MRSPGPPIASRKTPGRSALSAYERRIPKRPSLVLRRAASGEQGDTPAPSPLLSHPHKAWFLSADEMTNADGSLRGVPGS